MKLFRRYGAKTQAELDAYLEQHPEDAVGGGKTARKSTWKLWLFADQGLIYHHPGFLFRHRLLDLGVGILGFNVWANLLSVYFGELWIVRLMVDRVGFTLAYRPFNYYSIVRAFELDLWLFGWHASTDTLSLHGAKRLYRRAYDYIDTHIEGWISGRITQTLMKALAVLALGGLLLWVGIGILLHFTR